MVRLDIFLGIVLKNKRDVIPIRGSRIRGRQEAGVEAGVRVGATVGVVVPANPVADALIRRRVAAAGKKKKKTLFNLKIIKLIYYFCFFVGRAAVRAKGSESYN